MKSVTSICMGFLDIFIMPEKIMNFLCRYVFVDQHVGSNRVFLDLGTVVYINIFCFIAPNDITRRDEELHIRINGFS